MRVLSEPMEFEEAVGKFGERFVVASGMGSREWGDVPVALRERALFSSRVESAVLLQKMRGYVSEYLAVAREESPDGVGTMLSAQGRVEFVARMRELAEAEGLGRVNEKTGRVMPIEEMRETDLRDIRSLARLQLIFDHQVEAAQAYGYWQQGQTLGVRKAFPAQRFIRVRAVKVPRDYHAAAEGEVRLKDDLAFWLSMNRDFGVPWGPWGYNSGMDVEDVDRDEAEALGVLPSPDYVPESLEMRLNEHLKASVKGYDEDIRQALEDATGGRVVVDALVPRELHQSSAEQAPVPRGSSAVRNLANVFLNAGAALNENISKEQAEKIIAGLKVPAPLTFSDVSASMRVSSGGYVSGQDMRDAVTDFLALVPREVAEKLPKLNFKVVKRIDASGDFSTHGSVLRIYAYLPAEHARKTIFHELTHWLHENASEEYRNEIRAYFEERTKNEPVLPLPGFDRKCVGKKNHWANADNDTYAGRIYPWELKRNEVWGTEVVTRHLEKLANPAEFARNWNHVIEGKHYWREAFLRCIGILIP